MTGGGREVESRQTGALRQRTEPSADEAPPIDRSAQLRGEHEVTVHPETTDSYPLLQRHARKAWRHATGQRGTAPSLRGITHEQAKSIRERIASLTK